MNTSPITIGNTKIVAPTEQDVDRLILKSSLSTVENYARFCRADELTFLYRKVRYIASILERERGCGRK